MCGQVSAIRVTSAPDKHIEFTSQGKCHNRRNRSEASVPSDGVLFGAKRLPDAARSLGRAARILKTEVREACADQAPSTNEAAATPAPLPRVAPDAPHTNLAAGQKPPPHPAATTSTAD